MQHIPAWIDGDLAILEQHVARFVVEVLVPRSEAWQHEGRVDAETWREAAEAGLLCAGVPEQYGGGGGTLAHEALIQQELARAGLAGSLGVCLSIHSCIVAHYILAYGTDEQKSRWLPAMARADLIGAIAMTEPGTGSDLQAVRTRAVAVEGGYRLTGQKTFISNGQTANLVFVVARTGDGPGATSLSLLAVETATSEGFTRGRKLQKLGLHAQDTSELFFDNVFVPAENLLGEVAGHGFKQLMHQLAWERMIIALNAMVEMERAVDLTLVYARERSAFGKTLFDFQNTQFVLADAKTRATVARTFVDALLVRLFAGELDGSTAAMAKLWVTDTSFQVIDACQQLFGGYGYMAEYPIARLAADARAARVYGGANEIMKLVIARSL